MIVVRHGERLDKADKFKWNRMILTRQLLGWETANFRRDPPLTNNGLAMSRRVALTIKKMFLDQSITTINIYCSRLLRAVQTAREIALELKIDSVHISGGLASILGDITKTHGSFRYKTVDELYAICPGVRLIDCDEDTSPLHLSATDWKQAVDAIADRGGLGVVNIVVAHCETLRELSGQNIETPYCCFGVLQQPVAQHHADGVDHHPNWVSSLGSAVIGCMKSMSTPHLHTGDIYDLYGRRHHSPDRTVSGL